MSVISCLAKVMERFSYRRLLNQANKDIDLRQYTRHGHSTTQALIYLMQAMRRLILETALFESFYSDFTQGFDVIGHNIPL